jgi:hypothetical protein
MRWAFGCVVLFAGLVGDPAEAHAGGMMFGVSDWIAPIQDFDTPEGPVTLAYRYELTSFVFPLWLSHEEYVFVQPENKDRYTPLGESLDPQVQAFLGITEDQPAVPWGGTKFFAYFLASIIWWCVVGPVVWQWLKEDEDGAQPDGAQPEAGA